MLVGEDTIAAISTPVGEGAVGIVRLSGPQSIDFVQRFFRGRRPLDEAASHTLNLGDLIDGDGAVFDRALVAVMRAPRTYTGENMAEIHCHGGKWLVARVYARAIEMGARPAERGEFTRRALLNGKLDLAQAEAVIDLVKATSDRGLQVAAGQLRGRLSQKVQGPREELARVLTHIQAVIDYPEEDLVELDKADAIRRLSEAFGEVDRLRQTAHAGKIYYEGLRMGIVGKPNVGKSTLMNALLGEDRSIVTPIAGTTRDVIEAQAMVAGVAFTLFDTAGLRQTGDAIEQIGMARTDDVMASSDVLCHLFDASEPLTAEDEAAFRRALPFADTIPMIIGLSKKDLPPVTSAHDVKQLLQSVVDEKGEALGLADVPVVHFSAVTGEGVESLARAAIVAVGGDEDHRSDAVIVTRERHRRALSLAGECVARALDAIQNDAPVELVGVDLQLALEALAEVTGENVSEEIVGRIFAEFCVGK